VADSGWLYRRRGARHDAASRRRRDHGYHEGSKDTEAQRPETGKSRYETEDIQVASVKQLTGGGYRVTVTSSELSLIRSALDEAERVSRFGIEVLDEADRSRDGGNSADSRLLREIDALAMREASLRSLQKTMAEVDCGNLAPAGHADLDQAPRFTRGGW
jgi:hypothetical protein